MQRGWPGGVAGGGWANGMSINESIGSQRHRISVSQLLSMLQYWWREKRISESASAWLIGGRQPVESQRNRNWRPISK
jgi:hypothetical protein